MKFGWTVQCIIHRRITIVQGTKRGYTITFDRPKRDAGQVANGIYDSTHIEQQTYNVYLADCIALIKSNHRRRKSEDDVIVRFPITIFRIEEKTSIIYHVCVVEYV